LRIDAEIQSLIEHEIELKNQLESLHALIDQLNFEQNIINEEKLAEEI
jgi:hypothetical protein